MALAITPFQALCGFRPLPEIAAALLSTPELAALIPVNVSQTFISISDSANPTGPTERAALRGLFASVMTAEGTRFKIALDNLVNRYEAGGATTGEDPKVVDLVLKLHRDFPGDIGIFCAYLLNY